MEQTPEQETTPEQNRPSKRNERPFEPIEVGLCHAQTATERFGNDARAAIRDRERFLNGINPEGMELPFTWPGSDTEDERATSKSIYRLVPSMQEYRNNLTALSQVYNLYFVAYQGRIFVYQPKGVPKQTIPQQPDLQLHARPSKVALDIGGCVDVKSPHTINHIVVGMLGDEEIVVAAFDDGDVIAYYVKEVADSVFGKSSMSRAVPNSHKRARVSPQPRIFFHENVGRSAWGLAVHSKSRLIAVSSNRCEITVFAFALTSCRRGPREDWEPCGCCPDCENTEPRRIPRRGRNWRIIIALTEDASNIPNVCFLDNESGQAEMVCAVDIRGAMWLADIWKMFQAVTKIRPTNNPSFQSEEYWPAGSRGWGILAIPDDTFLLVDDVKQLLGQQESEIEFLQFHVGCSQPMVNMRKSIKAIPNNPCASPPNRMAPDGQFYHNTLVGLHNGSLHLIPGAPNADVAQGDDSSSEGAPSSEESGEEEEEAEGEDEDEDDEEEEDQDEEEEGEEEEGEEEEEEEESEEAEDSDDDEQDENNTDLQSTIVEVNIYGGPSNTSSNHPHENNSSLIVFSAQQPVTTYFPHELQDLDDALGQLGNAVQEYEDAISNHGTPMSRSLQTHGSGNSDASSTQLDMAFFPHNGKLQAIPSRSSTSTLLQFLQRPQEYNKNRSEDKLDAAWERVMRISERYRYIRAYEKDMELRSLQNISNGDGAEYGLLCPDVLTLGNFQDPSIRPYFRATSRLNMMVNVPELSMVVVGSPIGRVMLMTPTKLRQRVGDRIKGSPNYVEHGLRMEWILPFKDDEKRHRKAMRPLHGMAIGPVQYSEEELGGKEANEAAVPRRYRLMLHYRDHSILTYEITRDVQTGKLCIF
ncbi:hypothetical protein PT974_08955 [Cladobotryum mycophilum]|uniref:Pyridine nucleotide-disulfide oxidoreductase family protein n=1 Tax=Cladobotryum mycophilum TaxID=491253 RepID=A0ABR0SEX9_9HYPO